MPAEDSRNVADEFKGESEAQIRKVLDRRGVQFEIAIENTLRDYNMGSIVRTANAFGVRTVHVVGRRQWNKRGAMMTYKYLKVQYHASFQELRQYADDSSLRIIAIDNVPSSRLLNSSHKHPASVLLFGQEGPGLSDEALSVADEIVAIEQRGSTRSLNVAAAAAVVMYEWSKLDIDGTKS